MPNSIIQFVWRYSRNQQLWLILLTFVSFPLLYLSLEIPKIIINQALSGESGQRIFLGQSLEPLSLLLILSFSLLALVLINGAFKMYINTRKGIVGETLVRRLRYMLMERLLRFPASKFEYLSEGEMIATVVQETDPLGGFSGDAFALPLFQAGTLLTILLFMFMQDWVLGLASIVLVPLQLFIIPYLQRQINLLRKQRVKRVRALSNRIGETVQAVNEIRIQGTRRYTLAEFSYRFGELYRIRLELFKKKFFMKFVNNTLNQLTPFMFYAIGGYLVLEGRLTIGALVAAIAAHKDFLGPWRELLNFYQIWQDNVIRYQQVVEQFQPRNLQVLPSIDAKVDAQVFKQPLIMRDVTVQDDHYDTVFAHLDFQLNPGEWVAIKAADLRLRQYFARCLGGLRVPYNGFVGFGEQQLLQIPESELRKNIGMIDARPYLFNAAISYNLGYGLNHQPPAIETEEQRQLLQEAVRAGNSGDWFDETFTSVWTDYSHLGAEDWVELQDWLIAQFEVTGAVETLINLSLQEVFDPLDFPEELFEQLVDDLLTARAAMLREVAEQKKGLKINHYHVDQLNRYAPLLDNLIFGTLSDDIHELRPILMAEIIEALRENALLEPSLRLAEKSLRKLMLQYPSLPSNHRFIDDFELHDEERVATLRQLFNRLEGDVDAAVSDEENHAPLLDVFVRLVPSEWLEIWIQPEYTERLVGLRKQLMARLESRLGHAYFPFIDNKYNPGLSVLNNVLFGRFDAECQKTRTYMEERAAHWVLNTVSHYDLVRLFIINTQAGVGGKRIPEPAHHSISLLRTLLKRPMVMIMQDALGGRSTDEKFAILQRLRKARPDLALVWVDVDIKWADLFDRCLELSTDKLIDDIN